MSDTKVMTPGTPDVARGAAAPEVSFVELISILLRYRRLVFGAPVIMAILLAGLVFMRPRTYSATATFMPQSEEGGQGGGGLLAQLGIRTALGGNTSAGLYADLLTTQEILYVLATTEYAFTWKGEERRGDLIRFLEFENEGPADRRRKVLHALEKLISVETTGSGLIKVKVTTEYGPLSEQVAERLLELVGQFNLERRQTQAGNERRFAEGRVAETKAELNQVEEELVEFLRRNRQFENSPLIALEHARLQQEVAERRQLYFTLLELYEKARLEEVRNTPVITVVDHPSGFAKPNARGTVRFGIIGLLVGGVLGIFGALGLEFLRMAGSSQREDVRELIAMSGWLHRRLPGGGRGR